MKENRELWAFDSFALKKSLTIMRYTVFFLLLGILQTNAVEDVYAQKTKLALNFSDTKLEYVLNEIENQSEFYFLFNQDQINTSRKVNISVKDVIIDEVLISLFLGTDVLYTIIDRQIVLTNKPDNAGFVNLSGQQQGKKVTGKVTDQTGASLPGVSVVVKGTTSGQITDNNGNYALSNIPDNATLQFSFVGMRGQEITVGNKTSINVTLAEETIGIEEVVAVGYGTVKKSDITGSVFSLSNKKIENRPTTSILQSVQGNIAGLTITQESSAPGSSPSIYIRGLNSISASNTPLIIIDGIPGSLDFINPNDIESINVLKDASSAAIYGARGANGVVILTTKRGTGKPKITFNSYSGIKQASKLLDFMSPEKYLYYRQKFAEYAGQSANPQTFMSSEEYLNYSRGITTDWQDLVFKNAKVSENNLSIRGGENGFNYFLSASLLNHDHIAGDYNFKRKSLRLNIDKKFNWIKIENNLQVTEDNTTGQTGSISNVMLLNPYTSPTDPDGNTYIWPLFTLSKYLVNPLTFDDADINTTKLQIHENIAADIKLPIEGLIYRINYGLIIEASKGNQYFGINTSRGNDKGRYASKSSSYSYRWVLENILNYTRTFQNHFINFTGLYSAEKSNSESMSSEAFGFLNDALSYNNLSTASSYSPPMSNAIQWTLNSLMGRLNYNFKEKYMLTLTYRMDGYSAFGIDNKYGLFPSSAFAWRISKENFMKNYEFISDLKLRLSWGKNGNQSVSPYSSQPVISTSIPYPFGSPLDVVYGFNPSKLGNKKLRWETSTSSNIGIDFGFFDNRISGTVEYYHAFTNDLLLLRGIPYTSGFGEMYDNIGKVQNDGAEFTLKTVNVSSAKGFNWTSDLNLSYNKNQIVDLYGDKKDDIGNSWFLGKPIGVYYDYVYDGIWQESDNIAKSHMPSVQPGTVRVKDISGPNGVPDGKIDANDKQIVGKQNPDFLWGFTNNFQYKGFDLSIFIHGVQGVTGFNNSHKQIYGVYNNMLDIDYWLPEKPSNKYPTGIYNRSTMFLPTVGYTDASFIRLKDITFGYTFSERVVQKLNIDRLRIYLDCTNLFTISDWQLYDPETRSANEPMTKSYILGLNISF